MVKIKYKEASTASQACQERITFALADKTAAGNKSGSKPAKQSAAKPTRSRAAKKAAAAPTSAVKPAGKSRKRR